MPASLRRLPARTQLRHQLSQHLLAQPSDPTLPTYRQPDDLGGPPAHPAHRPARDQHDLLLLTMHEVVRRRRRRPG
jgi:hypothetical protein